LAFELDGEPPASVGKNRWLRRISKARHPHARERHVVRGEDNASERQPGWRVRLLRPGGGRSEQENNDDDRQSHHCSSRLRWPERQRFLPAIFLLPVRFRGTFPPLSRASDSPIAIACFRLVTFRPDPLFNVPRFRRRIALSTFLLALFPYLAMESLHTKVR
jgi:hypothetical protein